MLRKNDVDWLEFTAGEYKRTVTVLGDVQDGAKDKFQSELEVIHDRFKAHIVECRPALAQGRGGSSTAEEEEEEGEKGLVWATGEAWLASDAAELGLVDRHVAPLP